MPTSEIYRQHGAHPRNVGRIEDPDAEGRQGVPGCGNYMVITLSIESKVITGARFQTYGCPGAIACGSAVTEMAKGKSIAEALEIDASAVDDFLGKLPLGKGHCAGLAAGALRDALSNLPSSQDTGKRN
jgi:nitrogen fixation NifU-like protein